MSGKAWHFVCLFFSQCPVVLVALVAQTIPATILDNKSSQATAVLVAKRADTRGGVYVGLQVSIYYLHWSEILHSSREYLNYLF